MKKIIKAILFYFLWIRGRSYRGHSFDLNAPTRGGLHASTLSISWQQYHRNFNNLT